MNCMGRPQTPTVLRHDFHNAWRGWISPTSANFPFRPLLSTSMSSLDFFEIEGEAVAKELLLRKTKPAFNSFFFVCFPLPCNLFHVICVCPPILLSTKGVIGMSTRLTVVGTNSFEITSFSAKLWFLLILISEESVIFTNAYFNLFK